MPKQVPTHCGTRAGYRRCAKRPEGACEICKEAEARYTAEWRTRRPELVEMRTRRMNCRNRAMKRLADAHPDELFDLIEEEERKEGIWLKV